MSEHEHDTHWCGTSSINQDDDGDRQPVSNAEMLKMPRDEWVEEAAFRARFKSRKERENNDRKQST